MASRSVSRNSDKGNQSEHVFTVGAEVGLGTVGLGPEAARAASTSLTRQAMESYWTNKAEQTADQDEKERQRLAKIAAAQAGSSRQRLAAAKAHHEEEIRKMTEERKKFEKEFKERQEEEARIKNQIILREKEALKKSLADAKAARESRKVRELAKIRQQRQELLEVREIEKEAERLVAEEHAAKVKEWQEISRQRAIEEAQARYEQKCHDVKEINAAKVVRAKDAKVISEDIVHLKADMQTAMKQRMRVARNRVEVTRERELTANALQIREEAKKHAEKKRIAAEQFEKEKKIEASKKKAESIEQRELYRAKVAKKHDELRRQAKEMKAIAKAEMELEKEEQRLAHQEYIAMMRDLAARRGSPGGRRSPGESPSPNRNRGKGPNPMSPSKLAEHQ